MLEVRHDWRGGQSKAELLQNQVRGRAGPGVSFLSSHIIVFYFVSLSLSLSLFFFFFFWQGACGSLVPAKDWTHALQNESAES